jgi:hypothetical protein
MSRVYDGKMNDANAVVAAAAAAAAAADGTA